MLPSLTNFLPIRSQREPRLPVDVNKIGFGIERRISQFSADVNSAAVCRNR